MTHARHLAEDHVFRGEHGHRVAIFQGNRGVGVDELRVPFFLAGVLVAVRQAGGKAAEQPEDSLPLLLDMAQGRADANLEFALFDQECGRAEFSFTAHDFPGLKMPTDDRIAIPLKESRGNPAEERMRRHLFRRDRFGRRGTLRHQAGAYDRPVGQRSGRTGDHALAAGHAR